MLAHRIPWPPNKGDKIRSWRLVEFLSKRYDLSLGFFIDDPEDEQHVAFLKEQCAEIFWQPLTPSIAKLRSLTGLVTGQALSFPYYHNMKMAEWVHEKQKQGVDLSVAFSSSVVPYLQSGPAPLIIDMVDADSAKWLEYAGRRSWPLSWIYRREGKLLAQAEAEMTQKAHVTFLISDVEAELLRQHPNCDPSKVDWWMNGVDTDYFSADLTRNKPDHKYDLIFTGAMDYWANVEGIDWFCQNVLPLIKIQRPEITLAIVGANPGPQVKTLDQIKGVEVIGRVQDMRQWLGAAKIAIAPLRIARGIQNKVLEAMAMELPVIATPAAATGIDCRDGENILLANQPAEMAQKIIDLLKNEPKATVIAQKGRELVIAEHGWDQCRQRIANWL